MTKEKTQGNENKKKFPINVLASITSALLGTKTEKTPVITLYPGDKNPKNMRRF